MPPPHSTIYRLHNRQHVRKAVSFQSTIPRTASLLLHYSRSRKFTQHSYMKRLVGRIFTIFAFSISLPDQQILYKDEKEAIHGIVYYIKSLTATENWRIATVTDEDDDCWQ